MERFGENIGRVVCRPNVLDSNVTVLNGVSNKQVSGVDVLEFPVLGGMLAYLTAAQTIGEEEWFDLTTTQVPK